MFKKTLLSLTLAAMALGASAAQQTETLGRGVIAMKTADGVFVSWRSLSTDVRSMTFDVYRDGVKVNDEPLANGTNFTDPAGTVNAKYVIKALKDTEVVEETLPVGVEGDVYKRIHLNRPASGVSKPGGNEQMSSSDYTYTYTPNDCSVGDVDGDGEYEIIVKWDPSNSADNSQRRYTGNVIIDCYKLDGTQLWRIDLGRNIRAGAHYTQFLVYDFDGDGKAEMICKTAPGTIDGQGNAVLMGTDKVTDDYRTTSGSNTGIIVKGSEYLTVFNGLTGAEINTIAYNPPRSIQSSSSWGDSYGNRSERYLACVAYLDGEKPSAVMCRGYYTHSYLWAVDFDGTQLKERWLHASTQSGKGAYGEGAHSLTVGDVDGDGCDEIVYGSASIDHDGSLLYRTGAGHGDALHLGDFDPDRAGLEVFMVHEEKGSAFKYDCEFRDARTGEIIWYVPQSGNDIGRGLVGDISDNWRGYEIWPGSRYVGSERVNATFDCKGNIVIEGKVPSSCFRLYWDGDLLDELFDGKYSSDTGISNPIIEKRSGALSSAVTLMSFNKWKAQSCNTTKATPCLSADILGDWREEVILWDGENSSDLLVFSTTIPSRYRVPTLMHDHNYRMAIAWQNTAYNQPPHLGYYLPDSFSNDPRILISSGQMTQTVDLGHEIVPITGSYANATELTATGLPAGVELSVNTDDKTFTISGSPTAEGEFKYTINAKGEEVTTTLEGIMTVKVSVELEKLAYYPFETLDGSTPNVAVGSEATVYTSTSAAIAPVLTEGMVGNAIEFDGRSHYLKQQSYDGIQLGTDDFSVEFWFNSTDNAAYIFHKGDLADYWFGLELKNSLLKFAVDDATVKSEASCEATPYFDGQWHHCVLVREHSAGQLRIYLDGELAGESSDNSGSISDNNELLILGNINKNFDNYYKGLLDEFTIYKGALTSSRIRENYETVRASGIYDIVTEKADITYVTVVEATTGVIVARGVGTPENLTNDLTPGVYVLLIERGKMRDAVKFVKN